MKEVDTGCLMGAAGCFAVGWAKGWNRLSVQVGRASACEVQHHQGLNGSRGTGHDGHGQE